MSDLAAVLAGLEPLEPVGNLNPNNAPQPADLAEQFEQRIIAMMNRTGRDRTWCRAHCAEQHPVEARAYSARRNKGWRGSSSRTG